jgi:hypothetical protein
MIIYSIAAVEGIILSLFTYRMLYQYAHVKASRASKIFTFLGWMLGFSIICILPIDICLVSFNTVG